VVSQTTNPKRPGTVWNKLKRPTRVWCAIDESTGHVENNGLSVAADSEKIAAFEAAYGAARREGA
jgi:hypothetical protein